MKILWIVNEGSPGHLSQSRALADELCEQEQSMQIAQIDVWRRFSGLQRFIIRWLMGPEGRGFSVYIKRLILGGVILPVGTSSKPDLIISSGGKSVFTARLLANQYDVPYVFIGERKPFKSEWFHTVFTPSPNEQGVSDVAIDLIPTGVTPEGVAMAAKSYDRPQGKLWAMVIGGASRSHPYSESDWKLLCEGMNTLAKKYGIRWLLTTSRRTGAGVEELLRGLIDEASLADAIWWAEKPEKRMMAMLGTAERVFVTQDSVTMVTECVASGRAVVVLRPTVETFPRRSFMPMYLQRMEDLNYVMRKKIKDLGALSEIGEPTAVAIKAHVSVESAMAEHLLQAIG